MKSLLYKINALAVILFISIQLIAMDKDSTEVKSMGRVSIQYSSNSVYMGRTDSLAIPYLSPSIGYFHKSGFFINSSLSYLKTDETSRVDLITLSAGYDYYKKNFSAGFSLYEYFYNDLSYSVQSSLNTYGNVSLGYDFKKIIAYTDISMGFSEGIDVFWTGELTQPFYAFKGALKIVPSLFIKAGTQHYYDEYYATRSTFSTGKGGMTSTSQSIQVSDSEKFQIMTYEAELSLSYRIKSLSIFSSLVYAIPVNPSTIVTADGTFEEELNNTFYWSSGVRLSLIK